MTVGYKTGGRVKGVPNKRTTELIQKLEALNCDPITGMARIAMDETNPVELRAKMFAELAGLVAPKLKAMELSSNDEATAEPLEVVVRVVRPLPEE